jgi:hypothetical protein
MHVHAIKERTGELGGIIVYLYRCTGASVVSVSIIAARTWVISSNE